MTINRESREQSVNDTQIFFDRPGEVVAEDLAMQWMRHENRDEVFTGQGKILGLQTPHNVQYYRIIEAILFEDAYTRKRWPHSRAPEIASLEPGGVIGYSFHKPILTFFKTRGSENIMPSLLSPIDREGNLLQEGEQVTAARIAQLIGLEHRMRASLSTFDFRDEKAFLLSIGQRRLTDEELFRLEEEIFGE